jgi:multicomponent Na+:H+ antiporter subunit D
MKNLLIVAPILLPLATAIIVTSFWFRRSVQSAFNLVGASVLLLVGILLLRLVWNDGIQTVQIGNWPAPFGITIVADMFSAIMVLMTGITAFVMAIYSIASVDKRRKQFGYYSLVNTLYMGVCGAFITGDIFNMYVWFEVMLISSFVLLTLGGETRQIEGTFKYVTLNLISSAFFLVGIGFLYGMTGTLNMADVAVKLTFYENQGLITVVAMLFLIAFGIKAAVFPLFFWLPASYHTPPIAVTAIFAGLLSKVGVYSLIRIFTLIFNNSIGYTHTLLMVIAGFTMLVGVLGAASQYEMRRLLSLHIISQIGYMVMGLAIYTPLAIAGAILHILHNMIVKTNLFMVSGVINKLRGSYNLKVLGGINNTYPLLGTLFMLPALSLAGLPPLSGFWSKLMLIKAGFEAQQYLIIAISLVVSLLTLFSMTKIWNLAFWKDEPPCNTARPGKPEASLFSFPNFFLVVPVLLLIAATIAIGFFPEPFFKAVHRAAEELMNPQMYINTVLGGSGQ